MITLIFTKKAEKTFLSLTKGNQNRIIRKLSVLKNHEDIFSVLKPLTNFEPATHRLRIGNVRVILGLNRQNKKDFIFYVLDVGLRKDIYR